MSLEAQQIFDQAMRLSYGERFALTEQLSESLHPPGERVTREEWWEAWAPEIRRRLADSDAGRATIPADEVFAELKARRDASKTD